MIITFSGVDGSGKTTVAKRLKSALEHRNTGVSVIYVHVFQYFLLQPFINIFNKKPKASVENKFLTTRKKPYFLKLWVFIAFLDFLFFYFYLKIISLRSIVICDRYIYDRFLGLRYFGYSSKKIEHFLVSILPSEHTFFLYVPPKIAMSREIGDPHDFVFFSRMTEWYLDLLKSYPKLISINANKKIDAIVDEVLKNLFIT